MNTRQPIENKLFTYEKFRDLGSGTLDFWNVVLTVSVGSFPAGTKFPSAIISTPASMLGFMDQHGKVHAFNISLSVGEKVSDEEISNILTGAKPNTYEDVYVTPKVLH